MDDPRIRRTCYSVVFVSLIGYAYIALGFSGGITGMTRKNGEGCVCHGSISASVKVSIIGPETLAVKETARYTLSITGGPAVKGGTNIAASEGTLTAETGLRFFGGELTHQSPRVSSNGEVVFTFTYTAPTSAGTQVLYAAGNSVNGDGSSSGDQWNFAPDKMITVVSAIMSVKRESDSSVEFELLQNYPNPFNPKTVIGYQLKVKSIVTLRVFDAVGREVAVLVNEEQEPGTYQFQLSRRGRSDLQLSGGVYFYTLTAGNHSKTKKMLVIN